MKGNSKMTTSVDSFSELGLSEALLKTLTEIGYETPSPIQAQCIPVLLDGRDLIGMALDVVIFGKNAGREFCLAILQGGCGAN